MRVFLYNVFFNIYLVFSGVQADIGDDCQLESTNSLGHCTLLKSCPGALKEVQEGKRPQVCGFQGKEPIVCCTGNIPTNAETLSLQEDKERISRKKCGEYGQSIFQVIKAPFLLAPNVEPQYVNQSLCPDIHSNFLIRGIKAVPKEYPHMALIGVEKGNNVDWRCSGALISEQYVLTTASCVRWNTSGTALKVRLGDLQSNTTSTAEDLRIAETIIHPEYKYPTIYNDIALLKLQKPVLKFTEYIRPACLPKVHEFNKTRFIWSGWNFQPFYVDLDLLRNILNKMTYEDCTVAFKNETRILPRGVEENTQLCVLNEIEEFCQISTGSPLTVFSDVYCMFDIIGLTAYSKPNNPVVCDSQPVIHTKVSEYVAWIEKIVWP